MTLAALVSSANPDLSSVTRRRDTIVLRIQELVAELGLEVGDPLPGERQLAVKFGVGRGSVREAIQFLATFGVLEVRHGGGSFLLSTPDEKGGLRASWRQWLLRNKSRVLETLEFRMGAEAFGSELAARRATPEDIHNLTQTLLHMKNAYAEGDHAAYVQSDLAFHEALLQCAGNETLREVLGALGQELLPERAAISAEEGRQERSIQEHFAIYDAVAAGDETGAADAMRQHLESVRRDVLAFVLAGDQQTAPPLPNGPDTHSREALSDDNSQEEDAQ